VHTPDPELDALRQRAARGDSDAIDELIEDAAGRGDLDELRRLADAGSRAAADQLVETAAEQNDREHLRARQPQETLTPPVCWASLKRTMTAPRGSPQAS
jgi:hypothetical protein